MNTIHTKIYSELIHPLDDQTDPQIIDVFDDITEWVEFRGPWPKNIIDDKLETYSL